MRQGGDEGTGNGLYIIFPWWVAEHVGWAMFFSHVSQAFTRPAAMNEGPTRDFIHEVLWEWDTRSESNCSAFALDAQEALVVCAEAGRCTAHLWPLPPSHRRRERPPESAVPGRGFFFGA